MSRRIHACVTLNGVGRAGAATALMAAVVGMAGCSADVGRFDLAGDSNRVATASIPTPSEPVRRNGLGASEPASPVLSQPLASDRLPPPSTAREPAIRMSGLPEAASREPASRPAQRVAGPMPQGVPVANAPVKQVPASAGRQQTTAATGEVVEVQQGDTLYAISRRHRVSVSELMSVNGLQNPNLRPGQKLTLPSGAKRAVAQRPANAINAPAHAAAPAKPAPSKAVVASPAVPAAAPADWSGSYTVAAGDSLYAIARKHHVKAADLQSANNIADPTKVRPGTVLKVPGDGPVAAPAPVAAAPVSEASTRAVAQTPHGPRPTIINAQEKVADKKVAALGTPEATQSDASPIDKSEPAAALPEPPKVTSSGKFRWPVKGKVIAAFGPRQDNTHNDGINISVPQGSDVLAAENGVVAYAGSELKGYGNLVLVRHDGNWVSAYAHNEALLVKRGDKVKRGQSIAKAGATGTVDQPQVHFELRQGSKPVDPLPHMEKN